MIIGSLSAYAIEIDEVVWSYSKNNDYKIPHSWDLEVPGIEESAYTDVLRVIDEINREKGNTKRYVLNNGRIPEVTDKIDIVPIFVDEVKNYQGEGGYTTVSPKKYYKAETIKNILNSKDNKEIDDLSYSYMQQEMRYYFGNGNKVQDIIIENKDKFNETVKDKQEKGQEEYLINGVYQSMDTSGVFNTLGITKQEFEKNFLDSNGKLLDNHNSKVLEFLKTKLENKGIKASVKDGELWTETKDGKTHRVIWNANLASRPEYPSGEVFDFLKESLGKCNINTEVKGDQLLIKKPDGSSKVAIWKIVADDSSKEKLDQDKELEKFLKESVKDKETKFIKVDEKTIRIEDKNGKSVKLCIEEADGKIKDISWYKNTLLTQINIFKELSDRGKILYTKDGSIIIENVSDFSNLDPKQKDGWSIKPIEDKEKIKTKVYDEILTDYVNLKNNKLTREEFEDKWDLKNDKDYEDKIKPVKEKNDELEIEKKNLKEKIDKMGGDSWGSLYYDYFESSWSDKEGIFNGTNQKAKEYMEKNNLSLSEFQKLLNDTKNIKAQKEKLEKEIPELLKKSGIERIANSDIIINKYGKRVEFRGRGRVDGTIDFGEGDNRLKISEQSTGKYGTNITFGPYVKLKNINYIAIGGQYSAATGGVGLSGKSSLTLEIDPTKVDKEGRLYQHALKDTWTDDNKIVLKSWEENPVNRNNFAIELKVSSLGKDIEIDMGRPLEYKAKAFYDNGQSGENSIKPGDILKYDTKFYSDSIAHDLILVDKGNEEEKKNGILGVHVKDSLVLLDSQENAIFKSMSNSGKLGYLSDTLTTSNKKTKFSSSVEEDKFEEQKIYNLIENIVEQKDSGEILKLSSHFQIPKDKEEAMKNNIEKIKKDKKVNDAVGQLKTLENYKKIELNSAINSLKDSVKDYSAIIPPDGISYSSQDKIKEKIREKFGSDEKIFNEISSMTKYAETQFKEIEKKLNELKPSDSKDEVVIGSASWPDKIADRLRAQLEDLKNPPKEKDPALCLAEYVVKFRTLQENLNKFNNLTKNDIYNYIKANLEFDAGRKENAGLEWIDVISNIFYTQRQTESLKELKTIISQIYDNNIYSKINKISKDEIDIFNTMVTDSKFDFNSKKVQATGGAVSGRFARDKFKGTIYSGYGIYETPFKENISLGFVVGGGTSSFHEIRNDDAKTVTTNSKIKGSRAYLGFFERMNLKKDLEWVNGIGVQYSEYDVDREMKNNYQSDTYKGKLNTYSGNIYSNLIYNYKINDTLNANIKGGLSYTLVNQDKVKEEDKPLSIEIGDQNFNYLDGQFGIGLTKIVLSNNSTSSLSGTLYTIYGITGYDNKDLKGNIVGSTSEFNIKGENYEKQSLKLKLNYDVNYDSGFNYGLEGSYTKNSNEDNITVGVKAGYTF